MKIVISLWKYPYAAPHAIREVEWEDWPTLIRFQGNIYVANPDDPNEYLQADEPVSIDDEKQNPPPGG